jgi:hypothetical protein
LRGCAGRDAVLSLDINHIIILPPCLTIRKRHEAPLVTYRIFVRLVSNKLAHSHFVPSRVCPKLFGGFVGIAYSTAKMVGAVGSFSETAVAGGS